MVATPASPDETPRRPLSTVEAQRATLSRLEDDRSLLLQKALIAAHFGGALPSPLETQSAPLGGGHRAVLMTGGAKDRKPFIVVLDDKGGVLWTKERPLAGIAPGVTEIVLLPGPDAEVRIAWYDAPTHLVAMRAWDAGGGILADFRLLEVESCTALSGLYWPGRGFIVVAAEAKGAPRAQLLAESGKLAWGAAGQELPWISRAGAPVSLGLDTDSSWMAFGVGEKGAEAHAFAQRFDAGGAPLWPRPLDLGGWPGAATARIGVARAGEGKVKINLPPGSARRALEISAEGVVAGR